MKVLVKKSLAAFMAAVVWFVNLSMVQFATQAAAVRLFAVAAAAIAVSDDADAITPEQAATLGNAVGREQRVNGIPGASDQVNGTITLRANSNATVNGGSVNGTTISLDQLFPGSSNAGNSTLMGNSSGAYGSMPSLSAVATTQTTTLMDASNTTGWANAYRTLRNSPTTNPGVKDDLRGDVAVGNTQSIAAGTDPNNYLGSMATSCTTTTTQTPGTKTFHSSDFRTCDRYVAPSACQVTRRISGDEQSRSVLSFSGDIDSSDYIEVDVGIVSATGQAANASGDYASIGPTLAPFGIAANVVSNESWGSAYVSVAPHATAPATQCTYAVTGGDANMDVTVQQVPSAGNGYHLVVRAMNLTWYNAYTGTGFIIPASVNVIETCSTIQQDGIEEMPEGCATQSTVCSAMPGTWTPTGSMADQVSTDAWQCVDAQKNLNQDGATAGPNASLNLPELFPGEPKGYDFPVCYKAVARNYVCSGAPDIKTDTCAAITANPQCVLVSSSCLPENIDEGTGQCLYMTDTYDCGSDINLDDTTETKTTVCTGPIRCMGTSCVEDDPPEKNTDFANAASQLSIANWAQFDSECVVNGDCELFKGEGHTCKVVFWGVQDCCDQPTGVNVGDYLQLSIYTFKAADKAGALKMLKGTGLDVSGAYEALKDYATTTINDLSKPIVSAYDGAISRLVGNDLTSAMGPQNISTLAQTLQNDVASWVWNTFDQSVAQAIFGPGFDGAIGADIMTSAVGQAMGLIASAYMYYQLFVLAVQIIWSCDEKEIELSFKRDTKSCHYLGRYCAKRFLGVCYQKKDSFCCYKTPLARILHEQIHIVTGKPWPNASGSPECKGIKASEFATIDWSRVDLSEWIALLSKSNLLATSAPQANAMYDVNKVSRYETVPAAVGASSPENTTGAVASSDGTNINAYLRAQLWAGFP